MEAVEKRKQLFFRTLINGSQNEKHCERKKQAIK